MGRKRERAIHGERVLNRESGATGTVIDVYTGTDRGKKPKAGFRVRYGVLPDVGPRESVLWFADECDYSGAASSCHRCGQKGHTALNCDKGDDPVRLIKGESIRYDGRNGSTVRDFVNRDPLRPEIETWFITKGMTASTGGQSWRSVKHESAHEWPDAAGAAIYHAETQEWEPVSKGDTIVRTEDGWQVLHP